MIEKIEIDSLDVMLQPNVLRRSLEKINEIVDCINDRDSATSTDKRVMEEDILELIDEKMIEYIERKSERPKYLIMSHDIYHIFYSQQTDLNGNYYKGMEVITIGNKGFMQVYR